MINVKTVVNRSVTGAVSGSISGNLQTSIGQGGVLGGLNISGGLGINGGLGISGGISGSFGIGGLNISGSIGFGGFGGMFSGNAFSSSGRAVTLGFKGGHPYAGYPGILGPLSATGGVAWPYRPSIEISRAVAYENNSPVHSMQDFRSFRNNASATISISGQFSAQTMEEGDYCQAAIHFFRVATLMSFGKGGAVPAGMPPPVLALNAYGPSNINNLPVVLDSMLQSYPPDVDYITVQGNEIPTIFTITATMTVMLAPEQLRYFSLDAYAAGNMQNFI